MCRESISLFDLRRASASSAAVAKEGGEEGGGGGRGGGDYSSSLVYDGDSDVKSWPGECARARPPVISIDEYASYPNQVHL